MTWPMPWSGSRTESARNSPPANSLRIAAYREAKVLMPFSPLLAPTAYAQQVTLGPLRAMALSPFAQAYGDALKDITTPDLGKIKLLKDLAKENTGEAEHIVQALANHFMTCPAPHRLPALYVMDCVLKSAGAPYPELLARVITQVFAFIWEGANPDLRSKLVKTAGTWKEHLPADVMATITLKMQPPQPAPPQQQSLLFYPPAQAPAQASSMPMQLQPPSAPQYVYSSTGQLMLAPMGALGLQQPMAAALAPQGQMQQLLPYGPGMQSYGGMLLPAGMHMAAAAAPSSQPVALPAAPASQPVQPSGVNSLMSALLSSLAKRQGVPAQQDPVQAAVDALFAASAATKSKFLDHQFHRNRRIQDTAQLKRSWYVKVDQWLEGTRAVDEAPTPFEEASTAPVKLPPVEEDPSQPACAISGEAFTRTYDPDTDKWFYEDAVVLTVEQAAAYGVMEGSIVKTSCLAGAQPAVLKSMGLQAPSLPARPGQHTNMPDVTAAVTMSASGAAGVARPPPGKRALDQLQAAPAALAVPRDMKRVKVDG